MTKLSTTTACFAMAVLLSGFLSGTCFAVKRNGNLEYWQTQTVSADLEEDWKIYVTEEFRLGRHNGNPNLHNVDMGVVYRGLADWLDIGMSFKKEYEKDSTGKFRHENRPHLNVTLKGKLFNLDTRNRARIEYRDREHKKTVYRFRNKTTFNLPVKLTTLQLQPYVAEEFFINLGENNINQNRLFAGFSWPVTKKIKSSLYYVWKTSRGTGGWVNTNVIGLDFKILF